MLFGIDIRLDRAPVGILVPLALVGAYILAGNYSVAQQSSREAQITLESDAEIASASVSGLSPSGELADIFSTVSNANQPQRDEKAREIIGKVVEWSLPIYSVAKREGFLVIETRSRPGLVAAFCFVRASEATQKYVLALSADALITCKGQIAGASMRGIEIRPALLR